MDNEATTMWMGIDLRGADTENGDTTLPFCVGSAADCFQKFSSRSLITSRRIRDTSRLEILHENSNKFRQHYGLPQHYTFSVFVGINVDITSLFSKIALMGLLFQMHFYELFTLQALLFAILIKA